MPANYGFGLDDDEGVSPACPKSAQHNPDKPIVGCKPWSRASCRQNCKLPTECEVLQHEVTARPKAAQQRRKKSLQNDRHESVISLQNQARILARNRITLDMRGL